MDTSEKNNADIKPNLKADGLLLTFDFCKDVSSEQWTLTNLGLYTNILAHINEVFSASSHTLGSEDPGKDRGKRDEACIQRSTLSSSPTSTSSHTKPYNSINTGSL